MPWMQSEIWHLEKLMREHHPEIIVADEYSRWSLCARCGLEWRVCTCEGEWTPPPIPSKKEKETLIENFRRVCAREYKKEIESYRNEIREVENFLKPKPEEKP